jgi:hypothetical protein
MTKSDVKFSAILRDVQKGYWKAYLTKNNGFQISQAASIPLKEASEHLYAGSYSVSGDTLNLVFTRNHALPNLEYVTLKGDTLFIKISTFKDPLSLKGWYVKK